MALAGRRVALAGSKGPLLLGLGDVAHSAAAHALCTLKSTSAPAGRGPGWPAEWPASQRSLSLYFWQSVSRPMWMRNMQAISWAANIVVTIYSERAEG